MGNGCAVHAAQSIHTIQRESSKVAGVRCNTSVSSGLVQNRITSALLQKKEEISRLPHITFSKIILRVHKLRNVQMHVSQVFRSVAHGKNNLNFDDLQECMHQLHCELSKEEIIELFDFVDIYESSAVSLHEFWVALTVGYILEAIPGLDSNKNTLKIFEDNNEEQHDSQAIRRFMDMSAQIQELLNLIVMAYFLFDTEGKGFIVQEALGNVLTGDHAVLEARFKEMDCDSNGTIDFGEFVYTFTSWIDAQDECGQNEDDI